MIKLQKAAMKDVQTKWDKIHSRQVTEKAIESAYVLREYAHLLPEQGDALDIACGWGGNTLFLAGLGFKTFAWDLSPIAIQKLNDTAMALGLDLVAEAIDVQVAVFPQQRFDVIAVSKFLDRTLSRSIVDALRPGGLLFYQTFLLAKDPDIGPSNPEFLLAENELLSMFSGLKLLVYYEDLRAGNVFRGFRNEAYLVGQKPLD